MKFSTASIRFFIIAALLFTASFSLSASNIELSAPADGAEISLMRSDWKDQVAKRRNRAVRALDKVDMNDVLDVPEKITFSFKNAVPAEDFVLDISKDSSFKKIDQSIRLSSSTSAEATNLEVGRKYFWRIRSKKAISPVKTFSTKGDTPRFIAVPGRKPVNVRDLGGKTTIDGRKTAQGKIFRGTEMHNQFAISEDGRKFMIDFLKIKTDLDFRYPREIAKYKESALGPQVKWVAIPINAYNSFTPEQNKLFCKAIKFFADPENYPVYMHCSGGVDRTGEIAYLLNMILNVDEETSLLDYEASSLSVFPRKRTIPYLVKWRKTIADMSEDGTSPQQQAINYLKKIGVTDQDIMSIRSIMLEKQ